jgi:hypothetical protein
MSQMEAAGRSETPVTTLVDDNLNFNSYDKSYCVNTSFIQSPDK